MRSNICKVIMKFYGKSLHTLQIYQNAILLIGCTIYSIQITIWKAENTK